MKKVNNIIEEELTTPYVDDHQLMPKDGMLLLYHSLNTKLIELATVINNTEISIADKDDKSFDRLMKAMVESKSIAENLTWLKLQLGVDRGNPNVEEKKKVNPIENRAR